MTRGRYAERARTKQSADRTAAFALAEADRLRRRIRQLEHFETENTQLRHALDASRRDVELVTSDKVREQALQLEETLEILERMRRREVNFGEVWRKSTDRCMEALGSVRPHDRAWNDAIAVIAVEACSGFDDLEQTTFDENEGHKRKLPFAVVKKRVIEQLESASTTKVMARFRGRQ